MNDIRKIIYKYGLPINKFTIKNNARIIDNNIVIKEKKNDNLDKAYGYLKTRAFDYFPFPIEITDKYEIYPFIEEEYEPREQKAFDLTYLLSLLHSKTTFYREIDINHNKEIYENIIDNLNYLNNYYNDLITSIESEVYMAPSSYLIARNINIIFGNINTSRKLINDWYKEIKDNKNERVVYINNNINLDHYIKSDKPYLISWNKSKIDSPIYDLLSFYNNHYIDFDFSEILSFYEKNYPLKKEEKLLLFSYMAIPPKVIMNGNEYQKCIEINKIMEYMYKSNNLIKNYLKE